ncbi:MFS transporter [Streptomyces sp. NPDC058740]|uniref:MFS transporter n=1 Tax=Streptomyces sp. NPDC058740 TaxID=3346619 RepID=UPI0036A3B883
MTPTTRAARTARTTHTTPTTRTTPTTTVPAARTARTAPQGTHPRPRAPLRPALLAALFVAPASMGVSGPSLALPGAARELGVAAGSAAWLMTAFGIGMAAGTPLLSATAGRRGPGGLVRAGAVLLVLGAALVLAAGTLPLAVAGRTVEAVGAAGVTVAAFRIAGRDRSGRAPGTVAVGSAFGGTLGLFAGAAAERAAGWQAALVLPLLSLLVLPPVLRLAGPAEPRPQAATGTRPSGVLRAPGFGAAAGLMLALSTVNFALLYGAPRRFAALTGWHPVETGAVAALAALAGALLSWRLIRLAPRLGTRRTRLVLAGGSATAAVLAALAPWPAAVLTGSGLSALATAGGQGILTGAATRGLREEQQGPAIGLFNLAFLTGVTLGPALAAAVVA